MTDRRLSSPLALELHRRNCEVSHSLHNTRKEPNTMPEGKHVRGVGPEEQRQYEHIKESAEKSGRYGKRAKEVAARTVMKHHKNKGHSKGQ